MRDPKLWNRLAAATGVDFAIIGVVIAIFAQSQDVENANDWITKSNEAWGFFNLLLGFAAIFFFWFTSIFVARLRQIEDASGTSGRLANAVLASGTTFAGALGLCIAVQWAARMLDVADLAQLSTAILEGPPLGFIIATYIGASGLAVVRAGPGVYPPSRMVAMLSLALAPAYVTIAGIQLFKNYAWIDETGYLVFLAWVLVVSAIGVKRWATIDEGWVPVTPADEPEAEPLVPLSLDDEDEDDGEDTSENLDQTVPIARTQRKPATRKKPAQRKATSKPTPTPKAGPRKR